MVISLVQSTISDQSELAPGNVTARKKSFFGFVSLVCSIFTGYAILAEKSLLYMSDTTPLGRSL